MTKSFNFIFVSCRVETIYRLWYNLSIIDSLHFSIKVWLSLKFLTWYFLINSLLKLELEKLAYCLFNSHKLTWILELLSWCTLSFMLDSLYYNYLYHKLILPYSNPINNDFVFNWHIFLLIYWIQFTRKK